MGPNRIDAMFALTRARQPHISRDFAQQTHFID